MVDQTALKTALAHLDAAEAIFRELARDSTLAPTHVDFIVDRLCTIVDLVDADAESATPRSGGRTLH
jgi:hypothetical protein